MWHRHFGMCVALWALTSLTIDPGRLRAIRLCRLTLHSILTDIVAVWILYVARPSTAPGITYTMFCYNIVTAHTTVCGYAYVRTGWVHRCHGRTRCQVVTLQLRCVTQMIRGWGCGTTRVSDWSLDLLKLSRN